MGFHYRINEGKAHFVTLTVVDWVDVFTRKNHKMAIVESLKYCQQHKGLEIFAWCLMTNHLHMIIRAEDDYKLSDILRDFKKYTSKEILRLIQEEPESRKKWLLDRFEFAGRFNPKIKNFKFWQDGNHPVELYSAEFTKQKLQYIHNNPVEEMFVENSHEYLFSSARNYADLDGLIDVVLI
ncbi:MAG: transposase [Bacteroidia bacterium]|jgi:REP element-mobilizing transposase RayT